MSIVDYIEIALIVISMFFLGFIIGHHKTKNKQDGLIIIEPTEDGERERIRFILNYDLEDIKSLNTLIFGVENRLSQNKQSL